MVWAFCWFMFCFGGPGTSPCLSAEPCDCLRWFDYDQDGDVDLRDFAEFQRQPPVLKCDPGHKITP